jgi:hypothetical protein
MTSHDFRKRHRHHEPDGGGAAPVLLAGEVGQPLEIGVQLPVLRAALPAGVEQALASEAATGTPHVAVIGATVGYLRILDDQPAAIIGVETAIGRGAAIKAGQFLQLASCSRRRAAVEIIHLTVDRAQAVALQATVSIGNAGSQVISGILYARTDSVCCLYPCVVVLRKDRHDGTLAEACHDHAFGAVRLGA